MKKPPLFALIGFILLLLGAALLLPGGRPPDPNPRLPWKIELDGAGGSRVFGLKLGQSTLADARSILGEQGVASLFQSPDGKRVIEAYFERIALSGLRADIILSLEVAPETMAAMFDRGARLSSLPSGVKKVTLADNDLISLAGAPIAHITYIPGADLDEPLLLGRFGEPARKAPEGEGVVHWLYPDKGLDIVVNREGREMFQYVAPARFHELAQPLGVGG